MSWKVTVRHGSEVSRSKLESLDEALQEARAAGARVLAEGGLGSVSGFREYEPAERVQARIEVSRSRSLGGPEGGIDLMGDGSVVAYSGAIRKQPLSAETLDEAVDALRAALS